MSPGNEETTMFDDIDEILECPACPGQYAWEEAFLGALGNRLHFRCPCCGMQWSTVEEDDSND